MSTNKMSYPIAYLKYDFAAAIIVFLIAIPLCLGIALASGAPLYSGLLSGIIGGIVVGFLSPSHISISGPSAGVAAVVLSAMTQVHDFNFILVAIFIAGLLQIIASITRLGFIADYLPSAVIKGMMSAIGILLIYKELPFTFTLVKNFSELKFFLLETAEGSYIHPFTNLSFHINPGAILLSFMSLSLFFFFENSKSKKINQLPHTILIVIIGCLINEGFLYTHSIFAQHSPHLVHIPSIYHLSNFWQHLATPDWQQLNNVKVYLYAFLFASICSLESLLNVTATQKLDPQHHVIDKNKELLAQGIGNLCAGLLGGIPITALLIRTSVNVQNQAKTRLSSILQGCFLLASLFFLSELLNRIPFCILASILIYAGYKLTKPKLYLNMYRQGHNHFIPFIVTVIAIVLFNLLLGIILGLIVSMFYILKYNSQARIDILQESHPSGCIQRLLLPQQTTFLNKASIIAELNSIQANSSLIIDARYAEFIDKEILEYIQEFSQEQAPRRQINVNLIGFKNHYEIHNHINFIHITTYNTQSGLSPLEVLRILQQGNQRFLKDQGIHRSNTIDIQHSAETQHPIAIVLGCIDSRVPVETIFDMAIGDLFCVRIAGNVINEDILASIEYGCDVVGAKLIVVLGHTRCGAIQAACQQIQRGHITRLLDKIKPAIQAEQQTIEHRHEKNLNFVTQVTHLNIAHSVLEIYRQSEILQNLILQQKIGIIGAIYDVHTGQVHFSAYHQELQALQQPEANALSHTIQQWFKRS